MKFPENGTALNREKKALAGGEKSSRRTRKIAGNSNGEDDDEVVEALLGELSSRINSNPFARKK
jgi:hypothetical protein